MRSSHTFFRTKNFTKYCAIAQQAGNETKQFPPPFSFAPFAILSASLIPNTCGNKRSFLLSSACCYVFEVELLQSFFNLSRFNFSYLISQTRSKCVLTFPVKKFPLKIENEIYSSNVKWIAKVTFVVDDSRFHSSGHTREEFREVEISPEDEFDFSDSYSSFGVCYLNSFQ